MDVVHRYDAPERRGARLATLLSAIVVLQFLSLSVAAEEPPSSPWYPPAQPMLAPDAPTPAMDFPLFSAPRIAQEGDPYPEELPPDTDATGETPDGVFEAPKDSLESVLRRLEAVERQLADEKAKHDLSRKEKEAADAAKTPDITWTDLSSEKWNVRLGGHMQLDSINWADASPTIPEFNYVEFRRLRLLADGVGYGVYDFRLQIDIEPEGGEGITTPVVEIKDAYLTMHELPTMFQRFRIGNFFVPFGLEQVTNDTNNLFLERSIPTAGIFTADREVGMALYGASDDLDWTWTTGFFADSVNEALKERQDDNQGQRLSGRLTHLLYYDEPTNGRYLVHTGAGVLLTHDQDDIVRFRARPQIHEGPFLIDTGNMPADYYEIGNLEFATVWGPWSLQSEAFYTNTDLNLGGPTPAWGMYVHSSYFLTGENRIYERFGQHGAQFARNVPFSNFFWVDGCCGPGAWEVKGRWSNLTLKDYGAGEYNDFTFGFNWYWSDRIRVMFDWIHPFTTAATVYGETQSDIIAMRFDYNF